MKKKTGFIFMGPYDPKVHHATFDTKVFTGNICTACNLEEAKEVACRMMADGVGMIELCGAFGAEGAQEIIKATEGKVAVGYVVHDREQDPLFEEFFKKKKPQND
ncbi:MAG: hypothetical protein GX127_03020 [Eubacteriaceae bacterium]|nr:hypothetical protein [Eubacteriaceae bacterium]